MSAKIDNINIDSNENTKQFQNMFCYFCKRVGRQVLYNSSSKKTWCVCCQKIYELKQIYYEECPKCKRTHNPVSYYISSEKKWCDDCQNNWQNDEIYYDIIKEKMEHIDCLRGWGF